MGISQSYGHLLIISATLRACVASTGFVLILVEKPFAHAFQDLQVLTRGNAVQVVKGISLQKVAKAKMEVSIIPWNQYPILNGNLITLFPFCHY